MGNKFKGVLLCTDLDDTLLTTGDKRLTAQNREAIEHFMAEGGYFTFATGRVPMGAKLLLDLIRPNVPMICFNGGAIYDFEENKILWGKQLDRTAVRVAEYVEENFPEIGIEVCTDSNLYFCKDNRIGEMHRNHENLPHNYLDYHNIFVPWKKIIFLAEEYQMPALAEGLANSPYAGMYQFVQSSANYYEVLPLGVSKGDALLELAKLLGVDEKKTIGIGDNYNDIELIKNAGIGIAVANAVSEAREAADFITVDNNSNALASVISSLEVGIIKFDKTSY